MTLCRDCFAFVGCYDCEGYADQCVMGEEVSDGENNCETFMTHDELIRIIKACKKGAIL